MKLEGAKWHHVYTVEQMKAFYLSRLDAIAAAAKLHGYAIGLHGSCRRDFDLMAMQWVDRASDKNTLAHAIALAACGITQEGDYRWEQKTELRVATSIAICWPEWHGMVSAGCIDLSLLDTVDPNQPRTRLKMYCS